MSSLSCILVLYRTEEEKPIERYKARIQIKKSTAPFLHLKKSDRLFLLSRLNDQAKKLGLESLDLNYTALLKSAGKPRINNPGMVLRPCMCFITMVINF